jgi:hypothetical protein
MADVDRTAPYCSRKDLIVRQHHRCVTKTDPADARRGGLSVARQLSALFAVLLALLLIGTACSSSDDDAAGGETSSAESAEATSSGDAVDAEGSFDMAAEEEAVAEEDAGAERAQDGAGSGGLSDTAGLPIVDTGRDIIFTASVSVEVVDVVSAGQEAATVIQGLGGVLFGQVTTSEGVPRSTLTFKVPPSSFQTALARLGDIGFLRDQVITADDVTERVVDLESQIITAQLSVDRLRGFLEQATTLTEIADLEQQLLIRETSLEQLRGRLRTIEGQVSLATITVTFTQKLPGPELTVEQSAYLGHDGGTTCPGRDELEADEGEAITICYRITNSGDTLLGELDVRDDGLGLDMDDLLLIDGSLDVPLAIGASVTLVAELEAELSVDGRAQATALPVSADGIDLLLGRVAGRDDLELQIAEDTSLPGFLDGLSTGIAVVLALVEVIVLAAGFLVPFVWLVPLGWYGRRWWKRRKAAKMPPPPAPVGVPTPPVRPSNEEPVAAEPAGVDASVERGQEPEAEG